jgi:hypothetical protein
MIYRHFVESKSALKNQHKLGRAKDATFECAVPVGLESELMY